MAFNGVDETLDRIVIWYKQGTSYGFEFNAGAWTKLGEVLEVPIQGQGNPTPVAIGGITIPCGETSGFYTQVEGFSNNWSTDNDPVDFIENAEVKFTPNGNHGYPEFVTNHFPNRTWNGTIHYTIEADTEKPTISCASNMTVGTDHDMCNASVTIDNPTADDCYGVDKVEFRYREVDNSNNPIGPWSSWMDESVNTQTFDLGKFKVRWRAEDAAGNKKGCNQYVTVQDNEAPDIKCKDVTTTVGSFGYAHVLPNDVDDGTTDNCSLKSLFLVGQQSKVTGQESLKLPVAIFARGVYIMTLKTEGEMKTERVVLH